MWTQRPIYSLLLVLAALFGVSCDTTSVSTSADDLIGGKWVFQRSQELNGTGIFYSPASSKSYSWWIHFDTSTRVTGRDACNDGFGVYAADDDGAIRLDSLFRTLKGCGPDVWADQYWPMLKDAYRFQIRDDELFLFLKSDNYIERVFIHKRSRCDSRTISGIYRSCK